MKRTGILIFCLLLLLAFSSVFADGEIDESMLSAEAAVLEEAVLPKGGDAVMTERIDIYYISSTTDKPVFVTKPMDVVFNSSKPYYNLKTAVLPAGASEAMNWSTSAPSIATVNNAGSVKLTGKTGTVRISAASTDGSGIKKTITINVKRKSAKPTPQYINLTSFRIQYYGKDGKWHYMPETKKNGKLYRTLDWTGNTIWFRVVRTPGNARWRITPEQTSYIKNGKSTTIHRSNGMRAIRPRRSLSPRLTPVISSISSRMSTPGKAIL